MIRSIIVFILSLFIVTPVAAKEVLTGGALQAYWFPDWDVDTDRYQPALQIRYISHRGDEKPRRIIDITMKASEATLIRFIRQHFDHVPETFFTYKEGFANQPGTAVVPHVRRYEECGSVYYEAKLTTFTADHHSSLSDKDTLKDEQFAGCGDRYPYVASYSVKEGISTALKSAPADNASTVYALKEDEIITKIKTVNSEWIYASLYSQDIPISYPEIRGYIRLKDLHPAN